MVRKILYKVSHIKNRIHRKYVEFKFKIYKKRAILQLQSEWFRDKRVAIVGGADSAFEKKLGNYIDGYDVVVRINKGVELIEEYQEYIGKRTDVLFHCLYEDIKYGGSPITLGLWRKHSVKKLVFSSNLEHPIYGGLMKTFLWNTRGKVKVAQMDIEDVTDTYESITPFYPTTGFTTIHFILKCCPKELYITGITFFKTPHFEAYRDELLESWNSMFNDTSKSKHNPHMEYLYVKRLYEDNPHIIIPDKTLKDIFLTN